MTATNSSAQGDSTGGSLAQPNPRSWLGRSYIARNWRGELALPLAYWINGALINLAAAGLAILLDLHSQSDSFNPSVDLSLAMLFWIFTVPLSVWQFVGIWRSAGHRLRSSGNTLWPVLARVAIVLSTLQSIATFHNVAIPQIREMAEILRGDPSLGPHVLRVLPNGVEAEYRGAITFGAADDLRALLDANPGVKVLHLNSIGGRVREARAMAALVRERGLITTTATQCASACTVVFLAGRERYLGSGATLGFHQETFPGLSPEQMSQFEQPDRDVMRSLGIPQDFIDHVFSTASSELWSPTPEELEKAHVINGVSKAYAITGYDDKDIPQYVDKILEAVGAFLEIKTADPADYAMLRNKIAASIQKGSSTNEVSKLILAWSTPVFAKYVPHSSDDLTVEFVRVVVKRLNALARISPEHCYYGLFPENTPSTLDMDSGTTQAEQREILDIEARVIADGARRNLPIPDASAEAPILAVLAQQLRAKDGDQAIAQLAAPYRPGADHAVICKAAIDLYTAALALPTEQQGPLLRSLLAGQ